MGRPPVSYGTPKLSKFEKREKEKLESKAPKSQHERNMIARLEELKEKLGMRKMRGGHEQSFSQGKPEEYQALEKEYYELKKKISDERAKAVEIYGEASKAVKDGTSWTGRILDQGMFTSDSSGVKAAQLTAQTTGLMSVEEYTKKVREAEGEEEEEEQNQRELEAAAVAQERAEKQAKKRRLEEDKKKRAKQKTMLSFDDEDGEEGADD